MSSLSDRLRNTRLLREMSQTELAHRIGVSQPTVANWESGAQYPRRPALERLSEALDVKPSWLIDGVGERKGGVRARYLATPVRHVPVYDWPPHGKALERTRPVGFVPVSSETNDLFALNAEGEDFAPDTVLIFEELREGVVGTLLVQVDDRHVLTTKLMQGQNGLARLIETRIPH